MSPVKMFCVKFLKFCIINADSRKTKFAHLTAFCISIPHIFHGIQRIFILKAIRTIVNKNRFMPKTFNYLAQSP